MRRKIGIAMLSIAGVFVAAWIRGLSVQDVILTGEGQRVITNGDVLVILTSSARDGLVWSREECEGISWLAGWQVRPTDGDDYFDPFEAVGDMIPYQLDFQMEFYGLEVGKYHAKSGETFSFWRISYAPIHLAQCGRLWQALHKRVMGRRHTENKGTLHVDGSQSGTTNM